MHYAYLNVNKQQIFLRSCVSLCVEKGLTMSGKKKIKWLIVIEIVYILFETFLCKIEKYQLTNR